MSRKQCMKAHACQMRQRCKVGRCTSSHNTVLSRHRVARTVRWSVSSKGCRGWCNVRFARVEGSIMVMFHDPRTIQDSRKSRDLIFTAMR